ncbi:transporter substrate-binding domain-containing protein [Devosia sp. PTR5]|uniref:Transporter substrate-binding domain-containing protein n=1 Tax=Devosia oryzisoli TaxID=2774138 RepID=A0A927FV52_9HYPH|nr:transporter substrate-binding domain-containing protein [Devosia oryzisoli]MBD8065428.1 transporter substrate-binding domain-containing protein [Devosia oryzisoli]
MTPARPHRWGRALLNIGAAACLLLGASLLPPDTSLNDRKASGVLKLCVPPSYPPLVTGKPDEPGYDIELARAIAGKLELRLLVNVLPSMGQDFNPRNWSLTRAQCDLVGGGVADTAQTRSFMQTLATGAETGWVIIGKSGAQLSKGDAVAVLPGTSGLDRIALSNWVRRAGLTARLAATPADLERLLTSSEVAAAITERYVAAQLSEGFSVGWLDPESFPVFPMAFGLWKGDQTLMRAVRQALHQLEREGMVSQLQDHYGVSRLGPG